MTESRWTISRKEARGYTLVSRHAEYTPAKRKGQHRWWKVSQPDRKKAYCEGTRTLRFYEVPCGLISTNVIRVFEPLWLRFVSWFLITEEGDQRQRE